MVGFSLNDEHISDGHVAPTTTPNFGVAEQDFGQVVNAQFEEEDPETEEESEEEDDGRELTKRKSLHYRAHTFFAPSGLKNQADGEGDNVTPGQQYVDIETGDVFTPTTEKFLDPKRFRKLEDGELQQEAKHQERGKQATIETAEYDVRTLDSYNEVTGLGHAWRTVLKSLMMLSQDEVNALRFTRALQLSLPFLTGYEAYLLDAVIGAFDAGKKNDLKYILKVAFRNRNVSRTLVQQLGRWDFIWHQDSQFRHARWYDGWGQVPVFGVTGFPATENFVATRGHAITSMLRRVLGKGFFWTRVITGREALVTDDPQTAAQNLAAESNGFELANRNQHGTYFGRGRTNAFRWEQRLPTDESAFRTFITTPLSTLLNNGVVHILRQLSRHYTNMIYQPHGNFAHQRMEQLNPFEFMRFHMPVILVALSTLRGLNIWDQKVLGPLVQKLQMIKPTNSVEGTRRLVREMQDSIVVPVCGGIASRVDPFRVLLEALDRSLVLIEEESEEVRRIIIDEVVKIGLGVGADMIANVEWKVPEEKTMMAAVLAVCQGTSDTQNTHGVCPHAIRKSLSLLAPKDKRTLLDLVKHGHHKSKPAKLIIRRTTVLLQREIRRANMDKYLLEVSFGKEVTWYEVGVAYWVVDDGTSKKAVYVYDGKKTGRDLHRFHLRETGAPRFIVDKGENHPPEGVKVYEYIEAAEAMTRAQRAYMVIELDHGKKFTYNAFMEFDYLRKPLRKLQVLAQIHCDVLDDARLNVLQSFQKETHTLVNPKDMIPGETYYVYHEKQYQPYTCTKVYNANDPDIAWLKKKKIVSVPPQNTIVIGGGPTGLVTTLHCLETVLVSDGKIRLYESRDAFSKAGATFERAQIVRLDARWIAMLRYHCGSLFEDVFIPASGETDPHYGNTLPSQGFIEITIKDLESLMHVQVCKHSSRGLLQHDTNSGAQYSVEKNQLVKLGKALKVDDLVLRKFNREGKPTEENNTWKVVDFVYSKALVSRDLELGREYSVFVAKMKKEYPYRLVSINDETNEYVFKTDDWKLEMAELRMHKNNLPTIYHKGVKHHDTCEKIVFEHTLRAKDGHYIREEIDYQAAAKEPFLIDVEHFHVAEAIGKPHGSSVHFAVTTDEPYGVCCMAGLKVSMGMHNFGNGRWQKGVYDDIRSHTDQNTRVIGDFTKTVNATIIAQNMGLFLREDPDWRLHFEKLITDMGVAQYLGGIWETLQHKVEIYISKAPYKRSHLQTRFFETGDNFYLGMELTREYDQWKNKTVDEMITTVPSDKQKSLRGALAHNIDRLWYDSVLETIRKGDVYNPGAASKVPRLYLIDSLHDQDLGALPVGESFRISDSPNERYEILFTKGKCGKCCGKVCGKCCKSCRGSYVVRNVEGYISEMDPRTRVRRGGNLTRSPDGNVESKVSIAMFPVAHYVNHRTLRLSNLKKGYVFAFMGDEQSTPHFMRYSGLTGACINSMIFNNFITSALDGKSFQDRMRRYSCETNWSNGEVVTRGTGANYGRDGFLRPGFPYESGINYLHSKVIEYRESDQDPNRILSRDWLIKFAAALVPRGMEYNKDYICAMKQQVHETILNKFVADVEKDQGVPKEVKVNRHDDVIIPDGLEPIALESSKDIGSLLRTRARATPRREQDADGQYWKSFVGGLDQITPRESKGRLTDHHAYIAERLEFMLGQIVDQAQRDYDGNERINSGLEVQPNSVDSIVDYLAVEAQGFANNLTLVAAFAAAALALQHVSNAGSAVLSAFTPIIAAGTIANVSRYKNRNEEWRVLYQDRDFVHCEKAIYGCMSPAERRSIPEANNPYFKILERKKNGFLRDCKYYGLPEPTEFMKCYQPAIKGLHHPDVIRNFMKQITTKLIPDIYHVNSYMQESLVLIYRTCEDIIRLENQGYHIPQESSTQARALFERMLLFQPNLESSLQRGPTKYGFYKKRKPKHSHVAAIFQWAINHFWRPCAKTKPGGTCGIPQTIDESRAASSNKFKPISIETKEIAAQAEQLKGRLPAPLLRREAVDLHSLRYATTESYVASVVIAVSWLSFFAGIISTIGNIGNAVDSTAQWALDVQRASSWLFGTVTPLGAILAMYHQCRSLFLIIKTDKAVMSKAKENKARMQTAEAESEHGMFAKKTLGHLKKISRIAKTQALLTFMRAMSALLAAIALPWAAVASEGWYTPQDDPLWVATASACMAALAIIFGFIVEYSILYTLDAKLGEYVCDAFRGDLLQLEEEYAVPFNTTETEWLQNSRKWEFVARHFLHRYRFDTIFNANRFGSILGFIQSGLDYRKNIDPRKAPNYKDYPTLDNKIRGYAKKEPAALRDELGHEARRQQASIIAA